MAPTVPLSPALSRKLQLAQRIPPPPAKLALQIVPMQLRVWLADQNDVACRPWYIFCLELYPRGKVINHVVHSPASEKPDALALLNFLVDHVLEPPPGEARHLPTHISFVDPQLTAALAPPLKRLKMEVGTLTLADGVHEYVSKFSTKLVELDKATRSDSSERPGLLSAPAVTPAMGVDLAAAAVQMYCAQPWKRTPEHVALEIRLPSDGTCTYRERYYVTVLGSGEKVHGFALVPSLTELREKYRRTVVGSKADFEGDSSDEDDDAKLGKPGSSSTPPKSASDVMLCAACGKRLGEAVSDDGARYVERCSGCRRLLYCEERCQKLDWRERHREECVVAAADPQYVFKREEWAWLRRELALLFLEPTAVPFDDLDAFEEHKWEFVEEASPPLYPLAFVTVQGSTPMANRIDRPSAKEVVSMTLIAKALTECTSPPPADGILHLASGVSLLFAENLADTIRNPR